MSRSNSVAWTKEIVATAGLITSMIILPSPAPAVAQESIGAPSQANARIGSSQNSAAPIEGVFRIGRTSIHCLRMPCPWRAIIKIRVDGLADSRPLWAGDELPIEASPADRQRIRTSWQSSGCLLVRDRLEGQRLVVRHVTGDC